MPPRAVVTLAGLMLLASAAHCFQLDPQAVRQQTDTPEFTRILREVLGEVKLGDVPSADPRSTVRVPALFTGAVSRRKLTLPAATNCGMTEVMYSCVWETKPNKHSVLVVQDNLTATVAGVLTDGWTRAQGDSLGRRYTEFTDSAGKVVVTVINALPMGDFFPPTYTVTLMIHRVEVQVR